MASVADRVKETTTTTGTGTYTLAGAVVGFQAFTDAFSNATSVEYAVTDGTDWEVGYGTFTTAGTTLTRASIRASSNADAAVNWSAGTKTIWSNLPADSVARLGSFTLAQLNTAVSDADVASLAGTETLTNKRVTPRILSAASYTTDTGTSLNCDNLDEFIVTAQAGALLFNNPTGTPTDGQVLLIAVTGTAARALTYGNQFEASTVALPTTTVTTARLNMGFIWRADTSKWVIVGAV